MLEAICRSYNVRVRVLKVTDNQGGVTWMQAGQDGANIRQLQLSLQGRHYENLVNEEDITAE